MPPAMTKLEIGHALAFLDMTQTQFLEDLGVTSKRIEAELVTAEIHDRLRDAGLMAAWEHYQANGGVSGPAPPVNIGRLPESKRMERI